MSSEWPVIALEKLSINFDSRRKPVKESERRKGPYPYYGASGIVDYVDAYIFEGEHLLIAEDGENLRTRQTPIAFLADGKFWVNNHAHIITGNDLCRTKFLKYSLLATDISPYLTGAVMPKLTKANLNSIELACPSLEEQDAIVAVLGALDDRITLLRETNTTLEAIAQALFKSWFVDFDPVHAKQQGRAPEGMDAQTAALFPDSFEVSELGMVPKGWSPVRLDSFVELAYGKALKAEARIAGDVPVYGSGGITGWHNAALVNQPSIIVGRKGTVGSLYWENRPFFPIDTVFYVKTEKPLTYVFQVLKSLGLSDMNTDAAVPGLNRENAYRLLVAGASEEVIKAFDSIASDLRMSVVHNLRQIETLESTRDTLLPRLISGQLRLPEAQALVDDAVDA